MTTIQVKVAPGATVPENKHGNDFASDVRVNEDTLIYPGAIQATIVPTGLHTAFDPDKYGLILAPRSSISKLPLSMANSFGIIEGEYRGDIGLPLRNTLNIEPMNTTDTVLTYDEETKDIVPLHLTEVPTGAMQHAKERFEKDFTLLYQNTLDLDIPMVQKILDRIFVTQVPTGTFFLPKFYRIGQVFLTPKVETKFEVTDTLSDTKRGTGGFGSTGVK